MRIAITAVCVHHGLPIVMPYKSKRSYGKSRKSFGRKRTTKKRYGKSKKGTYKKSYKKTSKAASSVNRTGWTAIPLQLATKRAFQQVVKICFADTVTLSPKFNGDGTVGAMCMCVSASDPNWVYYNNLNLIGTMDSISTQEGVNGQCFRHFRNWANYTVLGSTMECTVMPLHNTQYATTVISEGPPVLTFAPTFVSQNAVICNLDKTQNTFSSGTTYNSLATVAVMNNARNTIMRQTEVTSGAEARGCYFKSTYKPRLMYPESDLYTDQDFTGGCASGYLSLPTFCTNQAYFNIAVKPAGPVPVSLNISTGVTTYADGSPRPHRFTWKVTYTVRLTNPIGGVQDNAPTAS